MADLWANGSENLSYPWVLEINRRQEYTSNMLMIRLARFGAKKKPSYRVVVIDKERARDSRAVEVVGTYSPIARPVPTVTLKHERIAHWMKNGARPSDTVVRLMKNNPAPAAA